MIVAYISDPYLRAVVSRAAHPEEEVVLTPSLADEAVEWGFPRVVIRSPSSGGSLVGVRSEIPVFTLDGPRLKSWEQDHAAEEFPPGRLEYVANRLRIAIDTQSQGASWVDRTLADLSRAAGAPLPDPLRAFGRRVLEFPTHYTDLHAMAAACGMSRGALKARFRRRGLESPYTYLRWFRMMGVAYLLADREVTISHAAHRLGFTSDGNLCRTMVSLTGLTPTEVRTVRGWNRLLISFAWTRLTRMALQRWKGLDLFERRVA
jgi:AraC-like DNA-binding protein